MCDHGGTKIVADGLFSFALPTAEDPIVTARNDVVANRHIGLLQCREHQRGTRRKARVVVEREIGRIVDQLPEPSATSQCRCPNAVEQILLDKDVSIDQAEKRLIHASPITQYLIAEDHIVEGPAGGVEIRCGDDIAIVPSSHHQRY